MVKTSKKSPSKNKDDKLMFKLPKRNVRLRSEIFVESYPGVLQDEYDLRKEDFCAPVLPYKPLKVIIKSKTNSNGLSIMESNEYKKSSNSKKRGRKFEVNTENIDSSELIFKPLKKKIRPNTNSKNETLKVAEREGENMNESLLRTIPAVNNDLRGNAQPIELNDTNEEMEGLNGSLLGTNNSDNDDLKDCKRTKKQNIKLKTNDQIFNASEEKVGMRETLNETNTHLVTRTIKENHLEDSVQTKKKNKKSKINKFQKMADSIIESIDTSAIVEMLMDAALDNGKNKEVHDMLKTSNKNRKLTQIKNSEQNLDTNLNDGNLELGLNSSDCDTKNLTQMSEQRKQQDKNSKTGNLNNTKTVHKDSNDVNKLYAKKVEKVKSQIKEQTPVASNNSDLQTTLHENNSHIPLINTNDNNLQKSAKSSEQPKKRGRKPKILNNTAKEISSNPSGLLKYFQVVDKKSPQKNESTLQTENSELHLDNTILNEDKLQAISEKRMTRSRTSNILNTTNTSLAKTNLNKSGNSEPRKRGRPKSKPGTVKVNVDREYQKKKYVKMSKVTKEQIKNSSIRKIPKNRLDDVLDMIDNDDHPMWEDRNISCNPGIHRHWEPRSLLFSDQNMKLKYARQFLLRRDWINLSKILCLSNADDNAYYPLLAKYASLLLAHTDKEQFNKFVQFLTSFKDSSVVMKKCTKIPKETEE